jgi:hypothetical protein
MSALLGGFLIIATSVMITRAVWDGPSIAPPAAAAAFPALQRLEVPLSPRRDSEY